MPTQQTLASAMAAAFGAIDAATKAAAGQVGQQKYKYADLTSVIDAIKPALVANGLFFTQHPRPNEKGVEVETILHHASGEVISLGSLFVPADRSNAQAFGSALTYARRYGLVTAFGVPVEDDDGNAATKAAPKATPAKPANNDGEGQAFPPGPCRNISNLKSMARDIWRQIESCGDQDQLDAYLADKDVKAVLKQAAELTGAWGTIYYGDGGDNPGLHGLIAKKTLELSLNDFIPERNPIAAG